MMFILLFWERLSYRTHFSSVNSFQFVSNTGASAPCSRFPQKTAVLLAFPEVREKITRIMREAHAVHTGPLMGKMSRQNLAAGDVYQFEPPSPVFADSL